MAAIADSLFRWYTVSREESPVSSVDIFLDLMAEASLRTRMRINDGS